MIKLIVLKCLNYRSKNLCEETNHMRDIHEILKVSLISFVEFSFYRWSSTE